MKTADELMTPTSAPPHPARRALPIAAGISNSWDFGTASQFPALKSYKLDSEDNQIEGVLLCGQPGQQDTTPTRASRAECTATTLVPLP